MSKFNSDEPGPDMRKRLLDHALAKEKKGVDSTHVAQRLERRFGAGDRPEIRRKFYLHLAKLVEDHGETVLEAISIASAQAAGARQPDRYFCSVVKCILLERGIVVSPVLTSPSW